MTPDPLEIRLGDIERGIRKSRVSTVQHTISESELRDIHHHYMGHLFLSDTYPTTAFWEQHAAGTGVDTQISLNSGNLKKDISSVVPSVYKGEIKAILATHEMRWSAAAAKVQATTYASSNILVSVNLDSLPASFGILMDKYTTYGHAGNQLEYFITKAIVMPVLWTGGIPYVYFNAIIQLVSMTSTSAYILAWEQLFYCGFYL